MPTPYSIIIQRHHALQPGSDTGDRASIVTETPLRITARAAYRSAAGIRAKPVASS
jgi:hypothetical protein